MNSNYLEFMAGTVVARLPPARVRNGDYSGQMDSPTPRRFRGFDAPGFVGLLGNMKLRNTPAPNALTFDLSCYMLNG
jgi:hypothetical protein